MVKNPSKKQTSKTHMVLQPLEIVYVTKKRVSCNAGGGTLGHPKIWLEIGEKNWVNCPYCDRRFILEKKTSSKTK